MSASSGIRTLWFSAMAMVGLLLMAWIVDRAGALTSVRLAAHNLLNPGRFVLLAISDSTSTSSTGPGDRSATLTSHEIAQLQNDLLQNELQRRQLLIQNARLANEIRSVRQAVSLQSVAGTDLIRFRSLKSRILNRSEMPDLLTEIFIDAGRSAGLKRSELVVASGGMVLDQGLDQAVQNGQKVVSGMTVVGRIIQTSQWVSLVQPVTDKQYSAAVQLVRSAPHGVFFGAEGLLEGTGDGHCRVTGIAYTEAVSVGDEVFSADLNGINGPRLYYGKVIQAEFSAGGQWNIVLQPAYDTQHLAEVSVIQPVLNSARVGVLSP